MRAISVNVIALVLLSGVGVAAQTFDAPDRATDGIRLTQVQDAPAEELTRQRRRLSRAWTVLFAAGSAMLLTNETLDRTNRPLMWTAAGMFAGAAAVAVWDLKIDRGGRLHEVSARPTGDGTGGGVEYSVRW